MAQLFTNNATTVLSSALTATSSELVVSAGDGALFPNPQSPDYFLCTLQYNNSYEIVKVTQRNGDTFVITRGEENTNAGSFPAETTVELRITAGTIDSLVTDVLHYRGNWDVNSGFLPTNPLVGDLYDVFDTGIINGTQYESGDFIFWSGNSWIKLKNSAQVNSVNSQTGDVVISPADVGLGSVINQLQLVAANNLSDVASVPDARSNLGVDQEGMALRLTMAFL